MSIQVQVSCQKKSISRVFYCTILFEKNLHLKHTEFLLRLTTTISCQKQAEFKRSKNNDVEDKEHSGAPEKFEDEELEALLHDSCQMLAELAYGNH